MSREGKLKKLQDGGNERKESRKQVSVRSI